MEALQRFELAPEKTLVIPARWSISDTKASRPAVLADVRKMGETLNRGAEAICGLYLRLCDTIRDHNLTRDEVRAALSKALPEPRISELLRVANAPDGVYMRYRVGLVGFQSGPASMPWISNRHNRDSSKAQDPASGRADHKADLGAG